MKLLFHVQHLLGIGHARRASLLAQALVASGFEVTVANGGFPVPIVSYGGARLVQLPPARAADAGISLLVDAAGQPLDKPWKDRRAAELLALAAEVRPDVVLVEGYPFARRAFRFELDPLLAQARQQQPPALVACSVRDILVEPRSPDKERAAIATARARFDLILVHGDPALIPFEASFPRAAEIADLIRYTGYIGAKPMPAGAGPGEGEVLVSVGGGAVGEELLRTALAARVESGLSHRTWRLLAGPDAPPGLVAALRELAPPRVIVETMRDDLPRMLSRCAMSISQAGYNTVMDLLAAGCPAVLVPFAGPGQTEQTQRARLLAERGVVAIVEPAELGVANLADAIRRAAAMPRRGPLLAMDGAERSARLLQDALVLLRGAAA